MQAYKEQADLVKALAHPVRLQILDILSQEEEACVCHLTAVLDQRQPYVSQQLMVLREAGLVTDRRDGLMVYYSLAHPEIPELLALSRRMLARQGVDVTFPTWPASPLPGCPCPHCEEAECETA